MEHGLNGLADIDRPSSREDPRSEQTPDELVQKHADGEDGWVLVRSLEAAVLRAHSRADFRASLLVDHDFVIRWASSNSADVLGVRADRLVGTPALDYVHLDDLGFVTDVFAHEQHIDTSYRRHVRARTTRLIRGIDASGEERLLDAHLTNFLDDPSIGMMLIDLSVPTSMYAIDEAFTLVHEGKPLQTVLRRVLHRLTQGMAGQVAARIVSGGEVLVQSSNFPAEDEAPGPFVVRWCVPILPGDGAPVATLEVWSQENPAHPIDLDVASKVAQHTGFVLAHNHAIDNLARQAFVDPLTGLGNRRTLDDAMSARAADDAVLVLFVDIDRFKSVNDLHGHAVGDAVLSTVAQRLKEAVRSDDLVVRVGGDEFVVLVGRTPPPLDIIVERLTLAVSAPIFYDDLVLSVSASIGAASGPPDAELLTRADREMFVGKRRSWS